VRVHHLSFSIQRHGFTFDRQASTITIDRSPRGVLADTEQFSSLGNRDSSAGIEGTPVVRVNGVRLLNVDVVFYRGFRYPAEVISHCMWLYHRFPLSFREVGKMMLARGVVVSHEAIRQWCAKFGVAYAAALRRRRARAGDKWHLDEVFIKVNGVRQYLWRAVDTAPD
jgi:hypothetical protein